MFKNINKYLFFKNPLYHLYLSRHADKGFILNPNSLWSGNKQNGNRIMNGFLRHQGESFPIKYFWKNNASDSWKDYLNSFMWIRDLRTIGTNNSRILLRNFIKEWVDKNKYYSESSWKDDILSKRIFSLLTNLSFYFDTAEESFQKYLINFIYTQVTYLFSNVESKKNNIFCLKAKILASLCVRTLENKNLKLLKELDLLLSEDLLDDGMYHTRSPSEHFFILCSLIDIRNFLGTSKKKSSELK